MAWLVIFLSLAPGFLFMLCLLPHCPSYPSYSCSSIINHSIGKAGTRHLKFWSLTKMNLQQEINSKKQSFGIYLTWYNKLSSGSQVSHDSILDKLLKMQFSHLQNQKVEVGDLSFLPMQMMK